MYEITQTTGFFIINGNAYNLDNGTVVSYRSDSIVEEFESLEALKQECEARGIDHEFDAYEELLPKSEKIK